MSIERRAELAGDNVWFQLYLTDETVRASTRLWVGVTHLTHGDTPLISKRRRELRRGFKVPSRWPQQLSDFATHPGEHRHTDGWRAQIR